MQQPLSQSNGSAQSSAAAIDFFFNQVNGLAKSARDYSFGAHRLEGVPVGIAAVLQLLLQGGPRSVPNIGRARSTTRQNTQILVNRMVEERWVELVSNPAHKRSALVELTEAGRQLAQSVAEREAQLHQLVSPEVSAPDLEAATALLVRLREVLTGERTTRTEQRLHIAPAPTKAQPKQVIESAPKPEKAPLPEDYELPVNLL